MEVVAATWTERKAVLKKEICKYFFSCGANKQTVAKVCKHIKMWGEVQVEVSEFDERIGRTLLDDDCIVEHFSPVHREKVADWINRYAELHKEALDYLESQRKYGEETCWARDDFEYEDWLSTQPDGEIQVHGDRIEVYAFGYKEGFASSLPKQGKKPIGKTTNGGYQWEYPLDALPELSKTGLPVLHAIDQKTGIQAPS